MRHPKDEGDRSTLAIIPALHSWGPTVLLPFGENTRYDLVADDRGRLTRVQCKTGRLIDGSVVFRTSSSYMHHAKPKTPTRTCRRNRPIRGLLLRVGSVYLVPVEDVTTEHYASLRVEAPRNGQAKKVRFASTYEIGRVTID